MIALRRVAFSLLAVCVAFAAGLALGNGPLQGSNDQVDLTGANRSLATQVNDLRQAGAYDDALARATAPGLVKGRLTGRVVTLVVLPGVDPATVGSIRSLVATAGGQVAVTVHVATGLISVGRKVFVDSVGSDSIKGVAGLRRLQKTGTYARIGVLIARAYVAKSSGPSTFDPVASNVSDQLEGAGLVQTDQQPARRGSLVVMLDPGMAGQSSDLEATRVIERSILLALLRRSDGVVVASAARSDAPGGLVAAIITDSRLTAVSTLDTLPSAAGKVALVYAVAATANGTTDGRYGTVGGRSVLPPGLAPAS